MCFVDIERLSITRVALEPERSLNVASFSIECLALQFFFHSDPASHDTSCLHLSQSMKEQWQKCHTSRKVCGIILQFYFSKQI
jgi:hypothetical protein